MPITFFTPELKFTLKDKRNVRQWLTTVAQKEGALIADLNYIFCSDNYLLELNKKHLNHNTLTDIITFDTAVTSSVVEKQISGDIFISIERVKENAQTFTVPFEHELHRVMVHGLLHLLGYKDKKSVDKAEMTKKEDLYLKRY